MESHGFPRKILNQKKHGFTFPVSRWLKQRLRPVIDEFMREEVLGDLVEIKKVKSLVDDHVAGKRDYYKILLNLVTLAAWRKKYPRISVSK